MFLFRLLLHNSKRVQSDKLPLWYENLITEFDSLTFSSLTKVFFKRKYSRQINSSKWYLKIVVNYNSQLAFRNVYLTWMIEYLKIWYLRQNNFQECCIQQLLFCEIQRKLKINNMQTLTVLFFVATVTVYGNEFSYKHIKLNGSNNLLLLILFLQVGTLSASMDFRWKNKKTFFYLILNIHCRPLQKIKFSFKFC